MVTAAENNGPQGPWQDRVSFAPGGAFAYRPGELVVREELIGVARRGLERFSEVRLEEDELLRTGEVGFARFGGIPDPIEAMEVLRREEGIAAQVNHVLFASACCPPHPASPEAAGYYAELEDDEGGIHGKPFFAKPFFAKPFFAKSGMGGCGCCCGGGGFVGNPFFAKPFFAKPFFAKADPNPLVQPTSGGRRPSSARPADPPDARTRGGGDALGDRSVRVAVLDTGWAASYEPRGLSVNVRAHGGDHPDEVGDRFLDPAAGHGTFIAGVIEQHAPGCDIEVFRVLSTFGDGDEVAVSRILTELADRPDDERPHLVNLSFGGYSVIGMDILDHAIRRLDQAGSVVVASAGNESTCVPLYPAILPKVVSVGAIDADDDPAPFTNYGPWVQACALGADVVSLFYEGFDGAEPPVAGVDPDRFEGWAIWSGTSFAAPRVVAALAREVAGGRTPHEAVDHLIGADGLERKPMLGTVVR
jgi:hypothetical protein